MTWRNTRTQQLAWQLYIVEGAVANILHGLDANSSALSPADKRQLMQCMNRIEHETLVIRALFASGSNDYIVKPAKRKAKPKRVATVHHLRRA